MRLRRLTFALAATALAIACAEHLPDQDLRILDASPSAKTSPESMWKEYQADTRAANRTYHGKAVDISGKISAIVQDASGSRIMFNVQPPPSTAAIEARLLGDNAAVTLAGSSVFAAPDAQMLRRGSRQERHSQELHQAPAVKPS